MAQGTPDTLSVAGIGLATCSPKEAAMSKAQLIAQVLRTGDIGNVGGAMVKAAVKAARDA